MANALTNHSESSGLCPRCCTKAHRRPRYGFQPLTQLALPLAVADDFEFPAPATRRADWLEMQMLRDARSQRAAFIPVAGLAAVDDCL